MKQFFCFLVSLVSSLVIVQVHGHVNSSTDGHVVDAFGWIDVGTDYFYYIQNFTYASWRGAAGLVCKDTGYEKCGPGARLAKFETKDEMLLLSRYIKNVPRSLWFGLRMESGRLLWEDQRCPSFTNWDKDEPHNKTDGCVEILPGTMTWKVSPCKSKFHSICACRKDAARTFHNTHWTDVGTNSFYFIERFARLSWSAASYRCKRLGVEKCGQLGRHANFETKDEMLLLHRYLKKVPGLLWIGLYREFGNYEWEDQGPPAFTNWEKGEPNRKGGTCVVINGATTMWRTFDCFYAHYYICACDKVLVTTTTAIIPETTSTESTMDLVPTLPSGISTRFEPQGPTDAAPVDEDALWIDVGTKYVYYVHRRGVDRWLTASEKCNLIGLGKCGQRGKLVEFKTKNEMLLLFRHLKDLPKTLWIGLRKQKGRFVWQDQRSPEFTNWDENEPSHIFADCAFINAANLTWHAGFCKSEKSFICSCDKETVKPDPFTKTTSTIPQTTSNESTIALVPAVTSGTRFEPHLPPSSASVTEDTYWIDSGSKNLYYIDRNMKVDWSYAQSRCTYMAYGICGQHGSLAKIETKNEMLLLSRYLKDMPGRLWIGLFKYSGHYRWNVKSLPEFTNWEKGEPEQRGNDCVDIHPDTMIWNVSRCYSEQHYICSCQKAQTKSVPVITTTSPIPETTRAESTTEFVPMVTSSKFEPGQTVETANAAEAQTTSVPVITTTSPETTGTESTTELVPMVTSSKFEPQRTGGTANAAEDSTSVSQFTGIAMYFANSLRFLSILRVFV